MDFVGIRPNLILVEGTEDVGFISALIDKRNLCSLDTVEIYPIGKSEFRDRLEAISLNRLFRKNVSSVLVVIDADNNFAATWDKIVGALRNANLPYPEIPEQNRVGQFDERKRLVGIYILPDNSSNGMMEDAILRVFDGSERMKCVDKYLACVEKINPEDFQNVAKSKVHSYLADALKAEEEYFASLQECVKEQYEAGEVDGLTVTKVKLLINGMYKPEMRVSYAAQDGFIDMEHEAFSGLAKKITEIVSIDNLE